MIEPIDKDFVIDCNNCKDLAGVRKLVDQMKTGKGRHHSNLDISPQSADGALPRRPDPYRNRDGRPVGMSLDQWDAARAAIRVDDVRWGSFDLAESGSDRTCSFTVFHTRFLDGFRIREQACECAIGELFPFSSRTPTVHDVLDYCPPLQVDLQTRIIDDPIEYLPRETWKFRKLKWQHDDGRIECFWKRIS